MAFYLDASLSKLEEFEGSIPWMYRDTAGHVTVGVGLLLPDATAAQKLPFLLGGLPAGDAQIAAEFARVDALPMGRPALFYRKVGGPELLKTEIDALLRTVLLGFEGELRAGVKGYDALPDGVKMGLLDMIYNLGPAGLLKGFPKLIAAVESGNWAGAAAACERRGPGAARNAWTRAMFLQNVVQDVKAAAESGLKRVGFGLIGASSAALDWLRKKL